MFSKLLLGAILLASAVKCFGNAVTSDEYLRTNQKECFQSRSLVSCIKYKAARIIWRVATNSFSLFPAEDNRAFMDTKRIGMVYLSQPSDMELFNDARSGTEDNEIMKALKFVKRALQTFAQSHALQINLDNQSGIKVVDDESSALIESRGHHKDKKKRKWLIILPLIILMKIAHLKMTLVPLLLSTIGLNVVLVGGVGWIVYYLKYKTLCKIHPHLVQTHSHVWESDPEYSSFGGSSHPHAVGSYNSGHDGNAWASGKAYNGYNYLDTISKRV